MKNTPKSSKKSASQSPKGGGKSPMTRKDEREAIKSRAEDLNKESKSPKVERKPAKSENDLFPIVGVGASAGGLEAFTRLIKDLPDDTGMAFVLVQHLDPEHESKLPELLARSTKMPVLEVANNTRVNQIVSMSFRQIEA